MRLEDKEMIDYSVLKDEEVILLAQKKDSDAENYLLEKYREMAKNKAKLYYIIGADSEDVIQEAMIGLFKAIRSHNPERTASFRTYAVYCINNQIISAIKKANRDKHQLLNNSFSLENKIGGNEENPKINHILKASEDTDPEAFLLIKEVVEYIKDDTHNLFSDFESKVLREKIKGNSIKDISKKFHKSPRSVTNAVQRIKKKVVAYLRE